MTFTTVFFFSLSRNHINAQTLLEDRRVREDEENIRVERLKASLAKSEEELSNVNDILRRTTKGK